MGSGKSTLGKKLSKLMCCRFIDLDEHIEKKENTSVQLMFDTLGEAYFRAKETFYLEEIVTSKESLVIALGGGTICFGSNLQTIKQHGILIYLDVPADILSARISGSRKKRPLLQGLSGSALAAAITEKLEQRQPFYMQAHITVSGPGISAEILQKAILEAQQNHII